MDYVSTRGQAPTLKFRDALLTGLGRDGGLYLPAYWPQLTRAEIAGLAGLSYAETALAILWPFVEGEIERGRFEQIVAESYAGFRHPAICPLAQIDTNLYMLELFHGPTLAFKDVAMQLLARLMDHVLAERDQHATIVGATSGDTGGAAIEGFSGMDRTDMFILFPKGRVSDVQRRQMTTNDAANVHALAIEGHFDDCQDLVKAMFNDHGFRDRVHLSGVNSINWARIMAQIVYYFYAASRLGAPDRPVSFVVPTGNFGDIFAGYAAKRMGLPIERLVIATNENDILVRTLQSGRYEMKGVVATTSPSMDIQISSNFERLLFEASGRDSDRISALMGGLKQSGSFTLPADIADAIRADFDAYATGEAENAQTIASVLAECDYLLDPHSATGVHAARARAGGRAPTIVLATAHPAKFPDAVKAACGRDASLPPHLSELMKKSERITPLPAELERVQSHILDRTRAID